MRRRNRVLALAGVALCAAGALALTWTWTGEGANPNWDTCENWDLNFLDPCYPSSTEDDVTVPATAPVDPWTIRLITETIDNLSIRGSVNFESAEPQPGAVLDVHEVVIYGTDGQGLVVNLSGAKIWTNH